MEGVTNIYISSHGIAFKASCQFIYFCTSNQIEYEALLFGLDHLVDIGVTYVEAYSYLSPFVQQVSMIFQCNDVLLEICLDNTLSLTTLLL
jgi:ribonuclease HI